MARGWEDRSRDPPAEDDQGKTSKDERTELLVACTTRFTASLSLVLVVLGDDVGVGHRSALLVYRPRLERAVACSSTLLIDGGGVGLVVGGAVDACGLDVGVGVDGDYLVVGHGGGRAGDSEAHRRLSRCPYRSRQPTDAYHTVPSFHPGMDGNISSGHVKTRDSA
jgi:hypothetical protein